MAPACRQRNVSACAKFPRSRAVLPHHGLADAITSAQSFACVNAAEMLRGEGGKAGTETRLGLSIPSRAQARFSVRGFAAHGQSFGIRQPSVSLRAALSAPASRRASRDPAVCRCGSCMFGGHAIWREVSGRRLVGGNVARGRRMAGIHFPHVADRSRQLPVADRELDRELHICGSDRRSAPRHLPPSDRPRAELFFRPPAGHADEPHYRDVERGLYRRKHVRLERAAAVHGDDRGDRADWNRQPADGGRADRDRGRHGGGDVPSGRGGQAAA